MCDALRELYAEDLKRDVEREVKKEVEKEVQKEEKRSFALIGDVYKRQG